MARLIARRLSTACIARLHGGATPTVAAVFDLAGELAACVADASLLEEQLTPQLLRSPPVAAALAAAPIVMLDGNLSPEALQVRAKYWGRANCVAAGSMDGKQCTPAAVHTSSPAVHLPLAMHASENLPCVDVARLSQHTCNTYK